MRKRICILLFAITLLLFGCGKEEVPQQNLQMGNPWKDYASLQEAEAAAGFSLGVPETMDGFTAQTFRVMNSELLEVSYQKDDTELTIRKQAGEGQDLSGVYENWRTDTTFDYFDGTITQKHHGDARLTLIDRGGYSYSIYAPTGWAGSIDILIDFIFER